MFDALQKVQREKYVEPEDEVQKSVPDDLVLDDKVVSFFAPSSMVTEQFRRLRTLIIKPGVGKHAQNHYGRQCDVRRRQKSRSS
ncbi:MAG: hypothetical protein MZV70_22930 [Desulfobacterales bacterium]|nr:hypothetical protein [Desulfobacterales bacterium]